MRGLLNGKWRDAALLTLLCLTGLGIKGWLLWHTDVVSRDGIHYISYAARLRQTSWPYVFRHSEQHPMYPIHVLAAAEVVQTITGRTDVLSWQLAAQFTPRAPMHRIETSCTERLPLPLDLRLDRSRLRMCCPEPDGTPVPSRR